MTANAQHFCDWNHKTDNKMIVYSNTEDNYLLLIIDTNYWEIRFQNESKELYFATEDRQAIGSSDLLNNTYTLAVKATLHDTEEKTSLFSGPLFYNVFNVLSVFDYKFSETLCVVRSLRCLTP